MGKEHHCYFVGNCVGYRNIQPFILFNSYLVFTCIQVMLLLSIAFSYNEPKSGLTGFWDALFHHVNIFNHQETMVILFYAIFGYTDRDFKFLWRYFDDYLFIGALMWLWIGAIMCSTAILNVRKPPIYSKD